MISLHVYADSNLFTVYLSKPPFHPSQLYNKKTQAQQAKVTTVKNSFFMTYNWWSKLND